MVIIEGLIDLLTKLLIVYLVIIIGILWRFSPLYRPRYVEMFTKITIWVFFPITIISSFGEIESFAIEVFSVVAFIAVIVHVAGFISIVILAKNRSSAEIGARVFCSTFPNTLLWSFPIILAIIGTVGLFYAALYVFMTMLLRNSFGVILGILYRPKLSNDLNFNQNYQKISLKGIIVDMLTFPPFLAMLVGFSIHILFGSQVIGELPAIDTFKTISLYGSLLLVGISFQQLEQLHPKNILSEGVIQVSISRFFVSPFLVLVLLMILKPTYFLSVPILIQSMAPPAVSNIIYGKFFNLDDSQISVLITNVTLLALLLLPFELVIILAIFPIK